MIRGFLLENFNPPAWGNNVFKAHDPAPTFLYGFIPPLTVLGLAGFAFFYSATASEEAAQFKKNVRNFISEHVGLTPPTQTVKPE